MSLLIHATTWTNLAFAIQTLVKFVPLGLDPGGSICVRRWGGGGVKLQSQQGMESEMQEIENVLALQRYSHGPT